MFTPKNIPGVTMLLLALIVEADAGHFDDVSVEEDNLKMLVDVLSLFDEDILLALLFVLSLGEYL